MAPTKATDPANSENGEAPPADPATRANALIYYGALGFIYIACVIFIYIACVIFVFTAFRLYNSTVKVENGLRDFYPELLLCAIAVFVALLGVSLLRSVGLAAVVPGPVINPGEWELLAPEVKDGKDEAVSQYIRLRSLTGFTGTFTKLGLTGPPPCHHWSYDLFRPHVFIFHGPSVYGPRQADARRLHRILRAETGWRAPSYGRGRRAALR